MSENRNTVAMVMPGRTAILRNPRIVEELTEKAKYHGDIATNELRKDPPNYEIVNPHQALATLYFEAAETIRKLLEQAGLLTETLKNRVLVALAEAKAPAWVPTHRHYKGTLYRVTGIRFDAEHEELVEKIEYDDENGGKFVLARRRWESFLESGKPRYEFLYNPSTVKPREAERVIMPEQVPANSPRITVGSVYELDKHAKEKMRTGMDRVAANRQAAVEAGYESYEAAVKVLPSGDWRASS